MFSFQYPGPQKKIPLTTKIMMVVWLFVVLAILSFFTFSFLIIALLAVIVAFVVKLLKKNRTPISNNQPEFPKQHYSRNPKEKDNDIIDI